MVKSWTLKAKKQFTGHVDCRMDSGIETACTHSSFSASSGFSFFEIDVYRSRIHGHGYCLFVSGSLVHSEHFCHVWHLCP